MNIREDTIVFILQQIMFTFHGMGAIHYKDFYLVTTFILQKSQDK